MPSRRKLKKTIHHFFDNLILDVLTIESLYPSIEDDLIETILLKITHSSNELISRAHHTPCKQNKKEIKKYFTSIIQKLHSEFDNLSIEIEQLNQVAKKQL